MKKIVTEKEIEKYLVKKVKEHGGITYKFTSPTNAGVPDRLVVAQGCVFFVELKAPNGRLSARQAQCLNDIRGICYPFSWFAVPRCAVLSSLAEVDEWACLVWEHNGLDQIYVNRSSLCLCNSRYSRQLDALLALKED